LPVTAPKAVVAQGRFQTLAHFEQALGDQVLHRLGLRLRAKGAHALDFVRFDGPRGGQVQGRERDHVALRSHGDITRCTALAGWHQGQGIPIALDHDRGRGDAFFLKEAVEQSGHILALGRVVDGGGERSDTEGVVVEDVESQGHGSLRNGLGTWVSAR